MTGAPARRRGRDDRGGYRSDDRRPSSGGGSRDDRGGYRSDDRRPSSRRRKS